jgi:hypothetical protein
MEVIPMIAPRTQRVGIAVVAVVIIVAGLAAVAGPWRPSVEQPSGSVVTSLRTSGPEPSATSTRAPTPTMSPTPPPRSPSPGRSPTPPPDTDAAVVDGDALLVGAPFPIELEMPFPSGWAVTDDSGGLVQLSRGNSGHPFRTTIFFTTYVRPANDPCEESAGSRGDLETADDIAAAFADMPRLKASGPRERLVGGDRALLVTLSPAEESDQCPEGDAWWLWRGPNGHWLVPGEENDLWVVDLEPALIISVERFANSSQESLDEAEEMIAGIEILAPPD